MWAKIVATDNNAADTIVDQQNVSRQFWDWYMMCKSPDLGFWNMDMMYKSLDFWFWHVQKFRLLVLKIPKKHG